MSSETSSFEKIVPTTSSTNTPLQSEEETNIIDGFDFSEAEQVNTKNLAIIPEEKEEIPTSNIIDGFDFSEAEEIKVSNLEKLEYAFDKNTQMIGNIFRIGRAKVQDIFDEDKTFKDYILENEATRKKEIDKEHWKFTSGKYDDDTIVKAGELATLILDPGYVLAYATPWGRAAMKSYKMASLMGGTVIGADTVLRDLATTGEVDFKRAGIATGAGALLGPLGPAVGKLFRKYVPKATQSQIDEVLNIAETKIASKEGISKSELRRFRNIANDKEVTKLNKEVNQWTSVNFQAPASKATGIFKKFEKELLNKNTLLRKLHKISKGTTPAKGKVPGMLPQNKTFRQQLLDNKLAIKEANVALEKTKKEIFKIQQPKIQKYADLIAKRDGLILEKLYASESKSDWAVRTLLSATVKPLVGGATGLTAGVLFGDEDTQLLNWFAVGATLGATQKYIQASKKFKLGDKNKILGIIDSESVKYTLQQLRSFTSATSSTKLESYGGATEQVGKLLLESIDSTVSQKSVVANADRLTRQYQKKAYDLIQPYSSEEQIAALSIVRGKQLTKDTAPRVEELAKGIKGFLNDFKGEYNKAGFFSKKELDDYFPRVFDWEKINKDPDNFRKVLTGIFKELKYTNPSKAADGYLEGVRSGGQSVFNRKILSEIFTGSRKVSGADKSGNKFIYTPISEHIIQNRTLQGPYKVVEEVLEKNGFLVNDAANILTNLVNKSMKSIAFSRQFGENGQLLRPFFEQIKQKYISSGLSVDKANQSAAKEANLVADTVDAYFDRYGQQVDGLWRSSAAVLSTLSNLNMLGRVTISSLGDIVQPFQNSAQFSSWFKALPIVGQRGLKTAFTIKGETGVAKELNLGITNEIRQGLMKPLAVDGSSIVSNSNWMGETVTQKVNNYAFKGLGLEWLTGFARRFAYNVGAGDAYGLSKSLNKMVSNGVSLESRKALKVIQDLSRYNIKPQTAIDMAKKTNSIEEALKNTTFKKALNSAGITTSNRDALVPQISNRLLFTQSQNPWSRLMGQFMSWAMAKSAQTNKVLSRIENGNTKTLVKMLAVIPVYGGIQGLREFAKYGEVVTDFGPNTERWFAEAYRLSGSQGYLSDLFINKAVGPSSREPWYQFAPAFQVARGAGEVVQATVLGDFDKASRKFNQDIAPFPNWRNWISKLWTDKGDSSMIPIKGKLTPLKFSTGKLATIGMSTLNDELTKNENQEIDLVTEKKETQLPKQEVVETAKAIMPKQKPVDIQMDKLIEPKQKPTVVKEDVPYSFPKNVDMKFLEEVEGNKNDMYVPMNKGIAIGKSGATIGMGFDLGSRTVKDLEGLSPELIKKLTPYLGLKKQEAIDYVKKNPLVISNKEKTDINSFAKKEIIQQLRQSWKKSTGKSFDDLDTRAATAVTSVAFQHGINATKNFNFWKQVTTEDWSGAFANLLDWDGTGKASQTQTRREKEAKLLKSLFKKGDR